MDFFINMTDGIHNHFTVAEDPNAASGVNWPVTLPELIKRACPDGPQPGRLEINSHGDPACISLVPAVTHSNLPQFAGLIRQMLQPGGSIEILACLVGSPSFSLARAESKAMTPERFKELASEMRMQRRHVVTNTSPMPKTTFSPAELIDLAVTSIKTPRAQMDQEQYDQNGSLFCSNLASLTGCRVRAAIYAQTEEDELTGNRHYSTPFGNWEGHVYDYMPDRSVRYAGFNVARPIFRTHDEYGDGPLRVA